MRVGTIPVTVVTGFLGAGKTTLVNAWLAEHARGEIAVIVNELGAIGIDGELLAERARTLVEITGGCICCTTYAELVKALSELASRAPHRVIVETSGAASPAGVIRAISRTEALRLDGVITVVDATRVPSLASNDLALEQIGYADVVVLSRADMCSQHTIDEAREWVGARNGAAIVATSARGVAERFEGLLAQRATDVGWRALPAAAHASAIESVSLVVDDELDEDRFLEWMEDELARIAGRLLRTKGVLAIRGVEPRMILQGVADEVEVTFGAPWRDDEVRRSRLVIVGYGLDRDALARGFAACRAGRGAPT
ncbi:CobW family GTP-binding protein [Sandaracinus amylolyticus]|uniref:Putative metal chaperone n=1 Tax=Sandaracinus amylolyticus TaxID=927083 RepID=A0A0F6YNG9_9BACT|nr:GTP-binding protein [Sandaracinus amylolyticus]AKF10426.1 Putative metal chaperone [Sandaracinus amylolyticus]